MPQSRLLYLDEMIRIRPVPLGPTLVVPTYQKALGNPPPLPPRFRDPIISNPSKLTCANRGRLVQDRATKSPKLNCRNWECGVVIPVLEAQSSTSTNESKGKEPASIPGRKESESERALDVFLGTIPVPMVIPGRKYEGGSLRPWYFLEG